VLTEVTIEVNGKCMYPKVGVEEEGITSQLLADLARILPGY